MSPLHRRIGSNIKYWRGHIGMTQRELSEKAGVSIRSITKYETGAGGINLSTASRIAAVMGMDVSELMKERT